MRFVIRRSNWRLVMLMMALLLISIGCKTKPRFAQNTLPLPPAVDTGVSNGQFVQVDYGFGFPVPTKWVYLKLSADQEVDEVARFSDPGYQMIVRVAVQIADPSLTFSAKSWQADAQQDLTNHQFQVVKVDKTGEWKTGDSLVWIMVPFHVVDYRGQKWLDEEWGLKKDDLVVKVHAIVPETLTGTEKEQKWLKELTSSLSQLDWYTPIGSRGISVDRYELQHFTVNFCGALESGSQTKMNPYFDEMFPGRAQWNSDYQQILISNDQKSLQLKAELAGMVINGDYATATFTLSWMDKRLGKTQKIDKSFNLSKKEGAWKIVGAVEKD